MVADLSITPEARVLGFSVHSLETQNVSFRTLLWAYRHGLVDQPVTEKGTTIFRVSSKGKTLHVSFSHGEVRHESVAHVYRHKFITV